MLHLEQMRQKIADERKVIEHTLDILAILDTSLQAREKALDRYEALLQGRATSLSVERTAVEPSTLKLSNADTPVKPPSLKKPTNVSIYEEVLLSVGRPMYATALASAAEARGVVFRGKGDKADMIRNALQNSKRFVNMGGNTWWLLNRPIPKPDELPSQEALMR